jgi:hypothetical protein
MPDDVIVRIGLPLPVDVVTTISGLIDKAYPGTVIDLHAGHGRDMALRLPDRRGKRVTKAVIAATVAEPDEDGFEVQLNNLKSDGTFSFGGPEELVAVLAEAAVQVFDNAEVENYMEWYLRDPEDPYARTICVAIARTKGQTPAVLRQKAEERARVAEERLALWEAARPAIKALYGGARNALTEDAQRAVCAATEPKPLTPTRAATTEDARKHARAQKED